MKNFKLAGLGLAMMLCYASQAQKIPLNEPDYNKPLLFAELPDRIPVEVASLKTMLSNTSNPGKDVEFRLANSKIGQFSGTVISAAGKETGASSIVIRSSNFIGATLSISEVTMPDGSLVYRGLMMSLKHGDLLELQNIEGQYYFVKRKYHDLIAE